MVFRLSRVLIANRGEIAVRVIKACHELGIEAIAVYSEADADALHVQMADAAYCIGPAPVTDSYLNEAAIIEAARRSSAQAIHPGYGFLAENPEFATACEAAGLIFIGPPASAMRTMGDKSAAKRLAEQMGIPVVPGYHGSDQEPDALLRAAEWIGYPLVVKAAAGGGGRGMRVVERPADLPDALAAARREATAAFGDGRLLLERYFRYPRHVEIQVLADGHGNVIHLGDRDCSIQRRYQKVIEEAPAPGLDPAIRAEMGAAAVQIAKRIGYRSTGTVEFLVDQDDRFSFLEMNTRLQVEHSVTELVTGIDLVQAQLQIAMGEPLPWRQEEIEYRGHALQCRIYAEDPYNSFLPATGRILLFEPPEGGFVRNDIGTYTGAEVGPYYDPLLAKLSVWGANRHQALERMRWALDHCTLLGIPTNLPLLMAVLKHEAFRSGQPGVTLLEREILPALQPPKVLPLEVLASAALFELLSKHAALTTSTPWQQLGPWRGVGAWLTQPYEWHGQRHVISALREGPHWRLRYGEYEWQVEARMPRPDTLVLVQEGEIKRLRVAAQRGVIFIASGSQSFALQRSHSLALDSSRTGQVAEGGRALKAPLPGVVVRVNVREGDQVTAHQVLVIMEAMKMEHALGAPTAGIVRKVNYQEGERVAEGAVLVEIEPE